MFQRFINVLSRHRFRIATAVFVVFVIGVLGIILAEEFGEQSVGWDTLIYKEAAHDLTDQQLLYERGAENPFYYTSLFAALFRPLAELSDPAVVLVWFVLLIAAYLAQLWVWRLVIEHIKPEKSAAFWLWLVPFGLVSSDAIANLAFGNVIALLGLAVALAALGAVKRNPYWMGLAVAVIAISKPQLLAFPLILALFAVLDRAWSFLVRAALVAVVLVAICTVIAVAMTSADYVWDQLGEQIEFLANSSSDYPYEEWLAWNSSVHQTVYRFPFLDSIATPLIAAVLLVWLAHFVTVVARAVRGGVRLATQPDIVLLLAFAAYIVGMFSNHVVNDLLLGATVWAYVRLFDDETINGRRWTLVLFFAIVWVTPPATLFIGMLPFSLIAGGVLYWMAVRLVRQRLQTV